MEERTGEHKEERSSSHGQANFWKNRGRVWVIGLIGDLQILFGELRDTVTEFNSLKVLTLTGEGTVFFEHPKPLKYVTNISGM
jgi:hypothetical protein